MLRSPRRDSMHTARTITTGIDACSFSGVGAAVDAGDGDALA